VKSGSEQGWFPIDFLSPTPPDKTKLTVTTIASNPLMEESTFEVTPLSLPTGASLAPRPAAAAAAAAVASPRKEKDKPSTINGSSGKYVLDSPGAALAGAAAAAGPTKVAAAVGVRKRAAQAYKGTTEGELSLKDGACLRGSFFSQQERET
jgi:hypothetical protein